ncbi:MAG: DegV family protein [Syntrophomonadaceae bacterium]|nr:DegV family protein [Syntrophomonadaceae bacterium]
MKGSEVKRVALVTDSSCDLPDEIIKAHGITILPLKIVYPDREYQDRFDIMPDEVYARMPEEVPRTSMPSAGEVVQLLERLKSEGFREVLAVLISSGLSGTHDMFKMIGQQMENLYVEALDSLNLSMGLGFQVCEAAEQLKRNLKLEEIVANLRFIRQRVRVFYVIPSLQYLRKGGRIGLVEGTIGELLNIKPIISVNSEGKYFTFTKVRGRKASLQKLAEIARESIGEKRVDLAVMHGGAYQEAEQLLEKLRKALPNIRKSSLGQISPALGVHTGPGLVGVAFYEV